MGYHGRREGRCPQPVSVTPTVPIYFHNAVLQQGVRCAPSTVLAPLLLCHGFFMKLLFTNFAPTSFFAPPLPSNHCPHPRPLVARIARGHRLTPSVDFTSCHR